MMNLKKKEVKRLLDEAFECVNTIERLLSSVDKKLSK